MSDCVQELQTPGEFVQSLLAKRGWTQRILSAISGIGEPTLTRIVGGKQTMDAPTAIVLEEIFGVPAGQFLSLQADADIARARRRTGPDPVRARRSSLLAALPVQEMFRRGWLGDIDIRDISNVEAALVRLFGAADTEDLLTLVGGEDPETRARMAWLARVRTLAEQMPSPAFSAGALRGARPHLRALAATAEAAAHIAELLNRCGVRLLLVESLSLAAPDGACLWLDRDKPAIALSLRRNRIDAFWLTLCHMIEHVLRGETCGAGTADEAIRTDAAHEAHADEAAMTFFVPPQALDDFIARKAPFISSHDVASLSESFGLHPGIVAGLLQARCGAHDRFRRFFVKVREIVAPTAAHDGWGDVAALSPAASAFAATAPAAPQPMHAS